MKESTYPVPADKVLCDTPEKAAEFWRHCVDPSSRYTPGAENMVVLFLNTRRRITGFQIVSTGTLDTILVHAREVFRAAIIEGASAIVLMHNHPSGDPSPSEADIEVTRDLIRAGQLLKVEVLDHVVIGQQSADSKGWVSLREIGYFYN